MRFVNDTMKAVVLMACPKHAPEILDKLKECPDGNWFVMPAICGCRMGYWNNVSKAHESEGCAIFGYAETVSLSETLCRLAVTNDNGSLCPDCVAYEWNVTPSHIAPSGRDPVCGATVPQSDAITHCHNGQLFLFCSVSCRENFQKDPERYLSNSPAVTR